jgi:hypothetical protein
LFKNTSLKFIDLDMAANPVAEELVTIPKAEYDLLMHAARAYTSDDRLYAMRLAKRAVCQQYGHCYRPVNFGRWLECWQCDVKPSRAAQDGTPPARHWDTVSEHHEAAKKAVYAAERTYDYPTKKDILDRLRSMTK